MRRSGVAAVLLFRQFRCGPRFESGSRRFFLALFLGIFADSISFAMLGISASGIAWIQKPMLFFRQTMGFVILGPASRPGISCVRPPPIWLVDCMCSSFVTGLFLYHCAGLRMLRLVSLFVLFTGPASLWVPLCFCRVVSLFSGMSSASPSRFLFSSSVYSSTPPDVLHPLLFCPCPYGLLIHP